MRIGEIEVTVEELTEDLNDLFDLMPIAFYRLQVISLQRQLAVEHAQAEGLRDELTIERLSNPGRLNDALHPAPILSEGF